MRRSSHLSYDRGVNATATIKTSLRDIKKEFELRVERQRFSIHNLIMTVYYLIDLSDTESVVF
jgi:hypothetical protein